jgi:hypothetical protein
MLCVYNRSGAFDSFERGEEVKRLLTESTRLLAACDRLLATERDVLAMPREQVRWFMSKPGHRDCFTVARALKNILLSSNSDNKNEVD